VSSLERNKLDRGSSAKSQRAVWSTATTSMLWVIGKRSRARNESRRVALGGERGEITGEAAGSHATYDDDPRSTGGDPANDVLGPPPAAGRARRPRDATCA
jgi:hypothetical protein